MSQELIKNLRRTKLDAIIGHYSGGNDEGGIEGVEAVILKPGVKVEGFPANDRTKTPGIYFDKLVLHREQTREISLDIALHGHYKDNTWINECSFRGATADDIACAGIPEDMDLWTLVSPFEQAIHGQYGSFAGDYYVSGEFYATRDGRFHVAGIESVPREEDVCLVDENWS